ncbi:MULTISPECIES: hypothetical protein [unclassified Bradyrhizobium]
MESPAATSRLFEASGSEVPQPTTVMLRTVGPRFKILRYAFEAAGLHCRSHSADDEPQVVETWV